MEHLSYLLTGIITTETKNSQEVFEIYVSRMFPQVFNVIGYSAWTAVLVLVINSVSTLAFCFSDQLVIMSSLTLGNYFQLFNERMKTHQGQVCYGLYLIRSLTLPSVLQPFVYNSPPSPLPPGVVAANLDFGNRKFIMSIRRRATLPSDVYTTRTHFSF